MAFETREQVLEKVMEMVKPACPHCGEEMSLWEVPPISFSDGLGWGVPFMFMCLNDQCPLYVQGWDNLKENYAHNASYRCVNYPGTEQFELMPVFSPMGAQGQIIDDQLIAEQEIPKEATKRGFSILADLYVSKDGPAVLHILTDATEPMRVRLKAAEMIGDIGEIEAIDRTGDIGPGKLQGQCEGYMQLLRIQPEDLINCSYSDMLLQLNEK